MKRIFLLLAIFLGAAIGKTQEIQKEGEAIYVASSNFQKLIKQDKKINKTIDSLSSNNSQIKQMALDLLSDNSTVLSVKFDENQTVFVPQTSFEAKTREGFNIVQMMMEQKGDFYVDKKRREIYNKANFEGKEFIVKTRFDEHEWVITDEKKKIGDYLCTKAYMVEKNIGKGGTIKESRIVAWFADEIPLEVAPLGYYGLPGLVVMLEMKGIVYLLKEIKPLNTSIEYKLNKEKAISSEEFLQKKSQFYKNR